MLIKYIPREGESVEYQFELGTMTSGEAEAIERVTDWTYAEFQEKLLKGSMLAARAMLWVLRRRKESALRFSDLAGILANEILFEFDADEKSRMRDWLERNPDADRDAREALEDYLGEEYLAEASKELTDAGEHADGAGTVPKGQARKSRSAAATPATD